jgi:uncharacterized membrane protein YidH (DUF202 family)
MSMLKKAYYLLFLAFQLPANSVQIPRVSADQTRVTQIVNGAFMIAGAVAVLFVIIGAYRYVTSQGDSNATKTGKEMILYAMIGLVIVTMAFAIVQIIIRVVSS